MVILTGQERPVCGMQQQFSPDLFYWNEVSNAILLVVTEENVTVRWRFLVFVKER